MIFYVKHRLRDESVETFRCDSQSKAHQMCRDLIDVNEIAWVQDEQGRVVQDWGPAR